MYSHESRFCKSSASSLPPPDLLGATQNSGQKSKSQTAFKRDWARGTDDSEEFGIGAAEGSC